MVNMKKIKLLSLFAILALMLPSCKQEEIEFDYENIHFETRADAILLEVVVPTSTTKTDELYVAGAFSGGDEAAKSNSKFRLTPHPDSDAKWGVYLNPSDFVGGKTLADGFHFISKTQREERTLKNDTVVRYDNPKVGSRTILTIDRWAAYFDKVENPDEIEHDGYVIYVIDETGWDVLSLYAWGDGLPELFGSWPGVQATGLVTMNGVKYAYFDTGAANEGLTYNLIFNNNDAGKQLDDFAYTINRDLYLKLTDKGVEEISNEPEHDGFVVYALDQTGYDALALYGWYDGQEELFGGWPGKTPDGEVTIAGNKYVYFDMGEAHSGMSYHLIFNNNNGGKQLADFDFEITRDIYLQLAPGGVTEIDPNDIIPEPEPEPDKVDPRDDPDAKEYKLYISNKCGYADVAVYAYGTNLVDYFGAWPGQKLETKETVDGVEYLVITMKGNAHQYNLIFNNNGGGEQLKDFAYTIDHDAYLELTAEGVVDLKAQDNSDK